MIERCAAFQTAVGLVKIAPEVVEVGKNIYKRLKPPETLAVGKGKAGILGRTYYSSKYGFTISIPDDNWRFWEPSPTYIASMGAVFSVPWRELP